MALPKVELHLDSSISKSYTTIDGFKISGVYKVSVEYEIPKTSRGSTVPLVTISLYAGELDVTGDLATTLQIRDVRNQQRLDEITTTDDVYKTYYKGSE